MGDFEPKKMNLFDETRESTYTNDVIQGCDQNELALDNKVKRVLACRPILAFILKHTLSEFVDTPVDMVAKYIDSDIDVNAIPLNPGYTNTVRLDSQEDAVDGEGMLRYDIRTAVVFPGEHTSEKIKILINVEGQRKDHPGYDLSLRALFHCCRMISSQLGTEFSNKPSDSIKYGRIKKVYSIFICPEATQKRAGTIEEYHIDRNVLAGMDIDKPRYDIMRAVIVYASEKVHDDSGNELIAMITDLFDSSMSGEEKVKLLELSYGIPATQEVKKEVINMEGFAAMYMERGERRGEQRGEQRGIQKGKEATILELVEDGTITIEKGAQVLNITVSKLQSMLNEALLTSK